MPNLSSLVAQQVVITTICSAASDDKVAIMTAICFFNKVTMDCVFLRCNMWHIRRLIKIYKFVNRGEMLTMFSLFFIVWDFANTDR